MRSSQRGAPGGTRRPRARVREFREQYHLLDDADFTFAFGQLKRPCWPGAGDWPMLGLRPAQSRPRS